MRRQLPAVLAAALIGAACGGPGPSAVEVGIKQIALNLAFREEALAVPVEPEVIIRVVPAPEPLTVDDLSRFEISPTSTPTPPLPPIVNPCPEAARNAIPKEAVTRNVLAPPTPGRYNRRNTGSIEVVGGTLPISLPYPPRTTWDVLHSDEGAAVEWDVVKNLSDDIKVIDRLRLNDDDIDLVKRTTINGEETTEFNPTPPIRYYGFGVESSTWTEAGVDLDTRKGLVIDGRIDVRELVDVCGELIDTYRVEINETEVDLLTGNTSQNTEPNIWNVATHRGGLVVREEVHTTFTTEADGTPLTLQYDYVSTLTSIEPGPIEDDA